MEASGGGGVAGTGGLAGGGGAAGLAGRGGAGGMAVAGAGGAPARVPGCPYVILPVAGRDVAYSASRNLIYVSVPGTRQPTRTRCGRRSNDVVGRLRVPVGSNPGALALSNDGSTCGSVSTGPAPPQGDADSTPPVVGPLHRLPMAEPRLVLARARSWRFRARRCRSRWSSDRSALPGPCVRRRGAASHERQGRPQRRFLVGGPPGFRLRVPARVRRGSVRVSHRGVGNRASGARP